MIMWILGQILQFIGNIVRQLLDIVQQKNFEKCAENTCSCLFGISLPDFICSDNLIEILNPDLSLLSVMFYEGIFWGKGDFLTLFKSRNL